MTYDEMAGGVGGESGDVLGGDDNARRYQF